MIVRARTWTLAFGARAQRALLLTLESVPFGYDSLLSGYQTHIGKPVDPTELIAAVATLAGRA